VDAREPNGGTLADDVDGLRARRRRDIAALVAGAAAVALTTWAALVALADGFASPGIAVALGAALVGANLAPVVAVSDGRVEAFTPVGALLVPLGLLLPLPEAIVVYAIGETAGVLAAHRWDRHVGGPAVDAPSRTLFVVGKSILGAALGLVALQAVADAGSPIPAQLLAAVVGVAVSTLADHTTVAVVATLVRGARLAREFTAGLTDLARLAAGEAVAGALLAVLAERGLWSLLLGLAMLGLLVLASAAHARAAADREDSRALLRLAETLQEAGTVAEVEDALLDTVRRLLPQDDAAIVPSAPDAGHHAWDVASQPGVDRWLVVARIVDTRDYEQQPVRMVDAAVSLARVALTRVAAQEQLVEQDRLRSLVLSTVAHDLRSPLAIAHTGVETLRDRGEHLDVDTRERLLDAADRALDRVRRLVDDLLGLELAEETGRGDDHARLDHVADRVAGDLASEDVTVSVEVSPDAVAVDEVSLGRILENLVSNACKYSPSGGTVRVRSHEADRGIVVVVEDEGPGVPVRERGVVFEPFRQAAQSRDGVGLGLYIVRRFVELHGGRIWVDDADGGGAAFAVWLPQPGGAPEDPDSSRDVLD
jgi:signal transduction histidine kinase